MVVNHGGEIQYLSSRSEIENIERILAEVTGYIEEQDLPFSFLLPQGG
jgi:hypothetical protein